MREITSRPLSAEQQLFLRALRVHLNKDVSGTPAFPGAPVSPDEVSLSVIVSLGAEHKVLPMVYEGLHDMGLLSPSSPLLGDTEAAEAFRRLTYHTVIGQTARTCAFLSLYNKLADSGLRPLVMKGIICRGMYPKPDHRPSADEDLLVPPSDFVRCEELFLERGARPLHGADTNVTKSDAIREIPQERGYTFPDGLYIELHTALFSGDDGINRADELRLFPTLFDTPVTVSVENTALLTLAPHDHLLYLLLHAQKHFVHAGFGIRQVSDIGLFLSVHGAEVDTDALYSACESVRALRFAAAVFSIARNTLGIPFALLQKWEDILSDVDPSPLLGDILGGGIYGGTDGSRLHSTTLTLDAAKHGKKRGTAIFSSLFPDAKSLSGRYPYLKDRPYLLPAAWVQRIGAYAMETRGKGKDNAAAESLRIARERLRLLEYYGMIGK